MKLLFLTAVLFSAQAFASVDCVSTDILGYRLIITQKIGSPSVLTVLYKGRQIYRKGVVETPDRDGMRFVSLGFTNANRAPASLDVSVYREGFVLKGGFSEGSYLPLVPYMQLLCKQI